MTWENSVFSKHATLYLTNEQISVNGGLFDHVMHPIELQDGAGPVLTEN